MPSEKEMPEATRSEDPWRDVGDQFASLGRSLSTAFQQLQDDETTQRAVQDLASSVKTMAQAVSDAIDEAAASPEGRKFRADAEQAVGSAHRMGQEAFTAARPKVLAALESMRESLQSAIAELRGNSTTPES
jgi:phage-related protein